MNNDKYEKLIKSLNKYLIDDKNNTSVPLLISNEMDVKQLSESELYLAHTLLHQFYARGGIKTLTTKDIEELHNTVKVKINHSDFDRLDRI